jgi:prepilin-type N-terminal cleavage/methylation domain-containing protein
MKHILSKVRHKRGIQQSGFTIVELMIATAVLAVLLLLVTIVITNIGDLYYKGFNQARVQSDVRNISSQVTQDLELSGSNLTSPVAPVNTPGNVEAYCIGNVRYTFILGDQIGSTTDHVLWRDTDNPVEGNCKPIANFSTVDGPATGTELIAPDSRLVVFSVTQATATSPYVVNIEVAYGDNDTLCSASVEGSCTGTTSMPAGADFRLANLVCRSSISADQFCSTASLSTTVVQRITSGGG